MPANTPSMLVVGTGAMASLFAARLSAAGVTVTMLGTWTAGLEALKQQGVDVGIGRKLGELFEKNGLMKIEIGVLGAQWTSKHSEIDETEWMVLRSDLAGQFSESELNKYQKIDQQARQKGTRILFIPTFYAIGFVR